MAHKPGDDMNRVSGFQQLRSYTVPEAVNPDVDAFRRFNPKFGHCPMNAVFHNVVGQEGLALGVGEQVAIDVRLVVFREPVAQVFSKQLGHADWSRAIVTLRGAFLSSGVVQGASDVDELPLEVEATDFQGGNFAYAEAAHCCDEEHEFVGTHRGTITCAAVSASKKKI